jgi:quercetin dioxygenase-like cupin family protein
MNVEKLVVLKSDERGVIYDCGKLKCIERKKGTVSADHSHDTIEILYLIKGSTELTIGSETETVSAPVRITIPPKMHHKLVALTDIILLEDR